MDEFDSVGSAFNHWVIDRAAVYPDESTRYFLPRRRNSRTWHDSSVRALFIFSPSSHPSFSFPFRFFPYEAPRDGHKEKGYPYRYTTSSHSPREIVEIPSSPRVRGDISCPSFAAWRGRGVSRV